MNTFYDSNAGTAYAKGYHRPVGIRAGIYGRNSKGEAKSIADQLDLGRTAVAEHGWTPAGEYSDDSSASKYRTKEREDWAKLLADLTAGALDVLVLWKPARGSRDELDWFPLLRTCADRGVLIHVIADDRTYDPSKSRDWKTLAEDAVAASHYSRDLSENVARGMRAAARKGKPTGRPTFGYTRTFDPASGALAGQEPNEHAPIVREIFTRVAAHTPINRLMDDFRARDLPSPSGKPWQRNTIRTIATNISYVALRKRPPSDVPGDPYPASWEPLVDEATFWRVQEILAAPERKTTKPGKAKYLLSWLARTPCGSHLTRHSGRATSPETYRCADDGCVSIRMAEADQIVASVLVATLRREDARAMFIRDDEQAAEARAEAARHRMRLEDARRSAEAPDGISMEALARIERSLGPLIEDAERRGRPAGTDGLVEDALAAPDPQAFWDGLDVAARKQLVGTFAEVRVGRPTSRLARHEVPEVRLLEAARRLAGSIWKDGQGTLWGLPT